MEPENPYQPSILDPPAKPAPGLSLVASLVSAVLAVVITPPLWLVSAATLQSLFGERFFLAIWAAALFATSALSVTALNLRSFAPPQSSACALTFAVLGAAYASFQLDSRSSLYWEVGYAYGVLVILPVWAYVISRLSCDKMLAKSRKAHDPTH